MDEGIAMERFCTVLNAMEEQRNEIGGGVHIPTHSNESLRALYGSEVDSALFKLRFVCLCWQNCPFDSVCAGVSKPVFLFGKVVPRFGFARGRDDCVEG